MKVVAEVHRQQDDEDDDLDEFAGADLGHHGEDVQEVELKLSQHFAGHSSDISYKNSEVDCMAGGAVLTVC